MSVHLSPFRCSSTGNQKLDRTVKDIGKKDERVNLLQTVDGVGPITALAFVAEEAALSLLMKCKAWSKLKAWGLKLMRRIGMKKALIAVARKLAVILHRMLLTNSPFQRGTKKESLLAA